MKNLRLTAPSAAVLLLVALTALVTVHCGSPGGEDPETPLEYGFDNNESFDCSGAKILDALEMVCGYFASCTKTAACDRRKQELFAGVSLIPVSSIDTRWNNFGGRGQLMGEGALCILKDLSNGDVVNKATAHLLGIPVSVQQSIGFQHFDIPGRSMDGYHTVSICLPVVGCFDAKMESFNAALKERNPAHPTGLSCGEVAIDASYGLQVTAEESTQALDADAPTLTIATPYGPIKATPHFKYYSDLHMIQFPLADTFNATDKLYWPIHYHDIYGRIPGVSFSSAPPSSDSSPAWISQMGLGSRQADPTTPQWTHSPDGDQRPDFALSAARSDLERKPVAGAQAAVDIRYAPPLPDVLKQHGLIVNFDVYAIPRLEVDFASQLDFFFQEQNASLRDAGSARDFSSIDIRARAEAYATFSLKAGLNLTVDVDLGFLGKVNLIDAHPNFDQPLASDNGSAERAVGAARSNTGPTSPSGEQYESFSTAGKGAVKGKDFVDSCLSVPVADHDKPVAHFTPGDGDLFQQSQFPCNICVGTPGYDNPSQNISITASAAVAYPSTAPSAGPADWTCSVAHIGCMDLCTYNKATNQSTVVKTAIQMGLKGPTGFACNEGIK